MVFADPLAAVSDQDQYLIATAAFTVTKASAVINDFVSASNYKAIPGAQMQYTDHAREQRWRGGGHDLDR